MEIYFIYLKDSKDSKDLHETRTMHTTNDNIDIMMGNETEPF